MDKPAKNRTRKRISKEGRTNVALLLLPLQRKLSEKSGKLGVLDIRGHPKAATEGHFKTGHFQGTIWASSLGCADGELFENGEEANGFGVTEAGLVRTGGSSERRESVGRPSPSMIPREIQNRPK